ncbi:MAG: secretion protein [Saprospirales bacterium]|nr:secretion protein [Saprospirales bacterium]
MNTHSRLFSLFFFFLFAAQLSGQDTFSIIAVDPETGEVGSAGASCVDASAFGGVILLNDIIPGKGGVNAQATVCLPVHINLVNAMARMAEGFAPADIIEWLVENDACGSGTYANRQYGIADFDDDGQPRTAAYTGASTLAYANHITGPNYSIQGNILLGPQILDSMEARFLAEEGPLAKKLMAALQGANVPGADTRCMAQGTSSRSAFLRVAKPDDEPGNFWLELNVVLTPTGVEPIDSLQTLFDEWYGTINADSERVEEDGIKVYPNPSRGLLNIVLPPSVKLPAGASIFDSKGSVLKTTTLQSRSNQLALPESWANEVLFLKISDEQGRVVYSEKLLVLPHD